MDAICSQRLRCLTEFSGYLNPRCAAAYNGNLNARRGSRCAAAPMRMRPHARCDQTAAETLRLSGGVKRDTFSQLEFKTMPARLRGIFKLMGEWIHTARSHFMQQRFPDVYGIAVGKYDFGFFAFSKPVAQPRGKFESARAASDNEDLMHHAPASSIFHEFHAFAPSLASGRGEAPVSVCLKSAKLLFN